MMKIKLHGMLCRFSSTLNAILRNLADTGRSRKRMLSVVVDATLVVLALWLAYTLRHGQPFSDLRHTWHLFVSVPFFTVIIFGALGIYRWVVRSRNRRLFRELIKGSLLSALVLVVIAFLLPPDRANPRSLFAIYAAFLTLGTCGVRFLWQEFFDSGKRGEPIAIYGAGESGRQLANLLTEGQEFRPVAFIDDDPQLHGSTVSGLCVLDGRSPDLRKALRRLEVARLILAMPSLSKDNYRQMLDEVSLLQLPVKTLPSISELVSGSASVSQIRDVSINDILGRTEVAPDLKIIGRRVSGRSVLVTGGGGSIGSELCRQIARLEPRELIVLDSCEANLYHITEELQGAGIAFTPRLGSVTDRGAIEKLISAYGVETIYHAAAYKHVPIVEAQPEQGVLTNVFGTLTLLEAAIESGVSDFVLISTDKAVRPANAMGASKRVAEMILQAKARSQSGTRISMVRFGNVLGSSGSVVPKFKDQILGGGPITITHRDITRYFMTIPEAAQLVLQASAIAKGGDVFVLDMGQPVRILDLAKQLVRLYGKNLREETNNPNDIEIVTEGLRPGEKMYEELFIGDTNRQTHIPKVFTADEGWLDWVQLERRLSRLRKLAAAGQLRQLRTQLMGLAFAVQPGTAESAGSVRTVVEPRTLLQPTVQPVSRDRSLEDSAMAS